MKREWYEWPHVQEHDFRGFRLSKDGTLFEGFPSMEITTKSLRVLDYTKVPGQNGRFKLLWAISQKILHSWKLDRWGYVATKFQANWSRNNFDRPPCVWKSHKIAFCYHVLGYYYAIGFDFFSTLSNMRGFLLDQSVWNFAPT